MKTPASPYSALYKYTKSLSLALGYRDRLTGLHSERVQGLAEALGRRCGMSSEALGILRIGAMFHDIGKIGVPDHILLKTSRFDEEEWGKMRQHPEIGARIMMATGLEGAREAAQVIRQHHEHYDGGGYPSGLAGAEITLASRIISIADSYDAMASTRSYHRGREHRQIMAVLEEETGRKHDPDLMEIFSGLIEDSPLRAAAPA
ncbi:MAG TPA: HD domain-containing phosphohydrolase [Azospira sp.]|nr:HD domain-containing phosphohydrolase [Azospira sp.]